MTHTPVCNDKLGSFLEDLNELELLDLRYNQFENTFMDEVCAWLRKRTSSLPSKEVKTIRLRGLDIDDAALGKLVNALQLHWSRKDGVNILDLADNRITDKGALKLFSGIPYNLETVVSQNYITISNKPCEKFCVGNIPPTTLGYQRRLLPPLHKKQRTR